MAVPTEVDGPATKTAGTVYVALGELEKERDLGKLFFGESARFLMPELVAHKSYYQRRQYRGERLEEYEEHLNKFRKLVRDLLNELERREVEPEEITELTRLYHGLADKVWQLEGLRVSMVRQLHNYDGWKITGDNDVLRYHRHHIQTTNAELELLVSDGQYALSVADPVLSLSRYRAERTQDKEEARRDRQTQTLLAVLAIGVPAALALPALALPALIDKDLAGWLIGHIPILEPFKYNTGAEFLVQFVLIVLLAIFIVLLAILMVPSWRREVRRWLRRRVYRWLSRRQKSHSSEGDQSNPRS